MPKTVDAEVLEGLKALQEKIAEGEKSIAFYVAQRDRAQETVDRETARVDELRQRLSAAKSRQGLPDETLTFDEATLTVKTATEALAEVAQVEAVTGK